MKTIHILSLVGMISIGLLLTFWKGIENFNFFYLFDGQKWKNSPQWRRFKRIGIGLFFLIGGLIGVLNLLFQSSKK